MRLFPLCVFALLLAGCSARHETPAPHQPLFPAKTTEPSHNKPVHHPVEIFTSATDLVNKPFKDRGEVSGEDCQATAQSTPATISTARKRMQINASELKANAILLHQCTVITTAEGCYRQAVCQGSALQVSQ